MVTPSRTEANINWPGPLVMHALLVDTPNNQTMSLLQALPEALHRFTAP